MNVPTGEPKDGDFVAYLEEIERRQMAHLPSPARDAAADAKLHAGQMSSAPPYGKPTTNPLPAALVGNLVLGVVGIFFLVFGLVGDAGLIAVAVGVFLIWRAAKSLSVELRRGQPDVRSKLAQALDAARKSRG
ncbi:MAG: hypothetical protein ACM3PU_07545 [Gemmatimonadota bacterium]